MDRRFPFTVILLVSAWLLGSGVAAAQVQSENRLPWTVTGQVFDVARVDNTLYVAGPANLGLSAVDKDEPFALFDPTTAARTRAVLDMSVPRNGSVSAVIPDGAGGGTWPAVLPASTTAAGADGPDSRI